MAQWLRILVVPPEDLASDSTHRWWVKTAFWAGEMAQRLRALTALPKVLSSNPSNYMVAHSHP